MISIKIYNKITLVIIMIFAFVIHTNTCVAEEDSDFEPSKSVFAKINSNFHIGLTNCDHNSAFEITRAYLGYRHNFDTHFSATIKLDIGSPNDDSQYSLLRRYAYFKTAALTYKKNKLTINFGLIDLYQFKLQERFWGYRYIYKSFQDEYKFGSSADIGANIQYKINDNISVDGTICNGEGYKSLQNDNTYKQAFGTTISLLNNFTFRFYCDFTTKSETESTFSSFIGYKTDRYNFAAEYSYRNNNDFRKNYNHSGYSIYGSYNITDNINLFARFDRIESNILINFENPWDLNKDGSAIISGIQYTPINRIKIALNYQDWYPLAQNIENYKYIYLNVEFSF